MGTVEELTDLEHQIAQAVNDADYQRVAELRRQWRTVHTNGTVARCG